MSVATAPTTWNLAAYYFNGIDDPRIDLNITSFQLQVAALAAVQPAIDTFTADDWADVFSQQSYLSDTINPVFLYLSLLSSKDTQDQDVLSRKAQIGSVVNQESKKLTFISDALRKMGYEKLVALADEPVLATYRKSILDRAKTIQYALEEPQEQVLMELSPVVGLFTGIYSELTNSFMYRVPGFEHEMTAAEVQALRESRDAEVRKNATDTIFAKFGEKSNQIVLGNIYKAVCKKNVANMRNRGIETVMFTRNDSEDMENEVVDALLAQITEAFPLYQRFLKVKAKLLGQEQLHYYDLLAPLPGVVEKQVSFEEGFALYEQVMQDFDPETFQSYSREMLDHGRIDVYPAKGKRSGAFAQYDKGRESMVLLNYTNTFGDVMTLAHELGHAIHGKLAQAQHRFDYHAPLCLAETASIFNEQLVFDSFYPTLSDQEKIHYTAERLTDIFSTMFRQVMYVRFERRCHEAFQAGQELGYLDFNRMWLEEVTLLYGDSVEIIPEMAYGWSSIPHIYQSPFYCYAYSFGMTVSFALYNLYQTSESKDAFVSMYKQILASGGSVPPKELLARYGIDISQPAFYKNAFELIEDLIGQLEAV